MAATELQLREGNNRMVLDATAKLVHIILQSRVVFSSGLFPTKDCDSFNLEFKLEHDVRTQISSWRQTVGAVQNPAVPMAVGIYHSLPPSPLTPQPGETLLEHWTLRYEPHLGGNRRAMDKKRSLLQTAVLVRAVYSFLYVVPTSDIVTQTRRHRGYGKLNFSFSSNPAAHPFDTADIENFSFGGVETEFGTLHVDVIYRRDCTDLVDSSFLNSSVHCTNSVSQGSGRPRTASGLGLGHLVIDDDYQAAPAGPVQEEPPVRKGTRPRTISLPQKPVLPGQAGSFPQNKSSSIDRTMPIRRNPKRKSVAAGPGGTWVELERGGLPGHDAVISDETEVLYSRADAGKRSSTLGVSSPSEREVQKGRSEVSIGQERPPGNTAAPHSVHLRRAETTPSVYQHPEAPVVSYQQVLPSEEVSSPMEDGMRSGDASYDAKSRAGIAEEAPFPEGFFVDAADALESSRVIQRSLVDGRRGERRRVEWADMHSDLSWGTAPGHAAAGGSPSVSPFKDSSFSAHSTLIRSRSLPKPSTDTAPLWASYVSPSDSKAALQQRPPKHPLSVSVSMEEEIADFIEACSSPPALDMCSHSLAASSSLGSSSGMGSSGWQGVESHHEHLKQLHLFAAQLKELQPTPYGTT